MEPNGIEPEIGKSQFQIELNKWFESRGIISDLRSHLRHLMISALQNTQIGLKPKERNSPKAQALNLMVAEYLFRHKCHYTLSVFTSEVPTLANFNPEGHKTLEKRNHPHGNCFQGNEVEEILNAMGMCSREDELGQLKSKYLDKNNEISLVELFIAKVGQLSTKLEIHRDLESHIEEGERLLSKKWSSRIADLLFNEKIPSTQITAVEEAIFRVTEKEIRRIVEEERRTQLQTLSQREKRIQEYLKKHEEDILLRLIEAERDLSRRKDIIDEELTEREKHLAEMAMEWKNKHEEILKLSKNFHNIETENEVLRKKCQALEEENEKLRGVEKTQRKRISNLEEEMDLLLEKQRNVPETNELTRKDNKEVLGHRDSANQKTERGSCDDDIPLLWSRNTPLEDGSRQSREDCEPKVKSKEFTIKNQTTPRPEWNQPEPSKPQLGSGDAKPTLDFIPSDDEDISLSSSSEEIILEVRKKLQDLEEESLRINQSYLEFKQKTFSLETDSSEDPSIREAQSQIIIKETKFSQTETEDIFTKIQKLQMEEKKQERGNFVKTKKIEEPPKSVMRTPTKRQLQHRDFFLKNRQLLQEMEKENLPITSPLCSTTSGDDLTENSTKSSPKGKELPTESLKNLQSPNYTLKPDIDCLALLEDARIRSPKVTTERKPLRQGILLSESEKEDKSENGGSSSSGKVSVGVCDVIE